MERLDLAADLKELVAILDVVWLERSNVLHSFRIHVQNCFFQSCRTHQWEPHFSQDPINFIWPARYRLTRMRVPLTFEKTKRYSYYLDCLHTDLRKWVFVRSAWLLCESDADVRPLALQSRDLL